jgi:hypothetical protein
VDVVCPYYLPVGVVRRPGGDAAALIVKVTLALGDSGWAELAREQAPLSGDCFDASGALSYPSDFQLSKRACDVVLVGGVLAEPGPAQLRVGRMRKQSESARGLGPRERTTEDGASAPEDQRLAFPLLPLELSVERARGLVAGALPGPAPAAALVYGNAWHAPYRVELVLDGVLVDVQRARCFMTFRGSFRHAAATLDGLAVLLDPSGSGRVAPQSMGSWARYACQVGEPPPRREAAPAPPPPPPSAPLRAGGRTQRMNDADTAAMRAAMAGAPAAIRSALVKPPERGPAPRAPMETVLDEEELPSHSTISMPVVTDDADGLPFTRSKAETAAMPTRREQSSALPFVAAPPAVPSAPVAPPGRVAVPSDDDDHDEVPAYSATVSLPRSPAAHLARPVLPFAQPASPPAPPPSDSGLPFVKAAPRGPDSTRRPVMMIGAIGTPLAYPPTPFANRGAAAPPSNAPPPPPSAPAIVAPQPPPSAPAIVAPQPPPSAPAIVAPQPPPSAPAITAPPPFVPSPIVRPAKAYDVPTYARGTFATGDANELSIPSGPGASTEPAAPPVKRIQGLSLEELAALRAELWDQPESRRAVLKRHGLSELRWRVVERAWAAELETMLVDPDKVGEAVSRMRSGRHLRPSVSAAS